MTLCLCLGIFTVTHNTFFGFNVSLWRSLGGPAVFWFSSVTIFPVFSFSALVYSLTFVVVGCRGGEKQGEPSSVRADVPAAARREDLLSKRRVQVSGGRARSTCRQRRRSNRWRKCIHQSTSIVVVIVVGGRRSETMPVAAGYSDNDRGVVMAATTSTCCDATLASLDV